MKIYEFQLSFCVLVDLVCNNSAKWIFSVPNHLLNQIPLKTSWSRLQHTLNYNKNMHALADNTLSLRNVKWEMSIIIRQATGLDAWASRVKCPARFVSHLHEICIYIYIWVVYSLCFFCCLFITVTWWYVWCFEWASRNQEEVQACLVTLWLSYHATVYTKPL